MSCFRAFDSNLPVRDVQIMGGGAGWRGAGGGQKKGNRVTNRCGKFKSSSKEGHPLIQSLRSWHVPGVENGSWNRLQVGPKLR